MTTNSASKPPSPDAKIEGPSPADSGPKASAHPADALPGRESGEVPVPELTPPSEPVREAIASKSNSGGSSPVNGQPNGVTSLAEKESSSGVEKIRKELSQHFQRAHQNLGKTYASNPIIDHGIQAICCFDQIAPSIHQQDPDIMHLLSETREELLDSYLAAALEREKIGYLLLRGVMEGLFTSLYYRQQAISLNLWASNTGFHMVHQFIEDKHEFYKYYKNLFEDDRFKNDYPEISAKKVFEETKQLYDLLSNYIHKKSPSTKQNAHFQDIVERVFRISLCFLEREVDLPQLTFPKSITYPQWSIDAAASSKKGNRK